MRGAGGVPIVVLVPSSLVPLTAIEVGALAALRRCHSDRLVAAELGLGLEACRSIVWALRAKLALAPGETILEAAARAGYTVEAA